MQILVLLNFSLTSWSLFNVAAKKTGGTELLESALDNLSRSLQYVDDNMQDINLDAVYCCRFVEESLQGFLDARPHIFEHVGIHDIKEQLQRLATKAGRIRTQSQKYLVKTAPEYYMEMKGLLQSREVSLWYASRKVNPYVETQPLPCNDTLLIGSTSNRCLREVTGSNYGEDGKCVLSQECMNYNMRPRMKYYRLSHQVIYFQEAEKNNCFTNIWKETELPALQARFCADCFRDAREISAAGYPEGYQDLFLEIIGLCGFWGYRDFFNKEWLEKILDWERPSGCYTSKVPYVCMETLSKQKVRTKRRELRLQDGCLSHKTGVAIMALTASIRFYIEKIAEEVVSI